jgi:hypothetical protein
VRPGVADGELRGAPVVERHSIDDQSVHVEHELAGVRAAVDGQRGRARQALAIEVDGEVEREVAHHGFVGPRERMDVVAHGAR